MDIKDKDVESNTKDKTTERDFPKLAPQLIASSVKVMGMLLPTVQAESKHYR